jgi:hypothetical protein
LTGLKTIATGGRRMHKEMTDQEVKESMRSIAKVAGLKLSEERIERSLPVLKNFLSDVDSISTVNLTVEDEPSTIFRSKKRPQR